LNLSSPEEFSLEYPSHFIVTQPGRSQVMDQDLNLLCGFIDTGYMGVVPASGRDKCTGPLAQLQKAFMLQLRVGFSHSIRANDELFCKRPYASQLITWSQGPSINRMSNLLHQLNVEGLPCGGVESKGHELNCTAV
jgi:hypothetical protein